MRFHVSEERRGVYSVVCDDMFVSGLTLSDLISLTKTIVSQKPDLRSIILQAMTFVIAVDSQ